jgi:hypothetical protein
MSNGRSCTIVKTSRAILRLEVKQMPLRDVAELFRMMTKDQVSRVRSLMLETRLATKSFIYS